MAVSPELTTLGSVVTRTGGELQTGPFGSQLHASDYQSTGIPLVMPVNLGDNEIREGGIARIGTSDVRRLRRHALRDGDIIFSRRGDVGRRSLVRKQEAGWLCGTGCLAAKFGTDKTAVNPAYVAEYLGSSAAQTWLVDNAVGGTMPNLNTAILAALPVLLPPKHEQDRVVSMFGDVRRTIDTLERLIAKKQAMKQGMMQQLLAGRTRLAGFKEPWTETSLGAIGRCIRGVGYDPDADLSSGDRPFTVRLLRSNNVQCGRIDLNGVQFVNRRRVSDTQILKSGDIVICMANGSRALVGKAAFFQTPKGGLRYTFGAFMGVFRTDTSVASARFVAEMMGTHAFRVWLDIILSGSSINNLRPGDIENFVAKLPGHAEQIAVAEMLSDAGQEIDRLQERLAKARDIKTGMMQQLLTGRIRIPVEVSA